MTEKTVWPDWLGVPCAEISHRARDDASARQGVLTKPPGSLGRLEELAARLAGMQRRERPEVERVRIVVFAGDHGVTAEGVSAYPSEVTAAMVANFARGGAAISVLARQLGAELEVINLGTVAEVAEGLPGVIGLRLGAGTANFTVAAAMSEHQLSRALGAGRQAAERARMADTQLFIGGEMGIGNTTAAAAVAAALLKLPPDALAGRGTGLDPAGVRRKARVIAAGLERHGGHLDDPLQALRRLGGFEIAALAGAFVACAQMGLPVLVDGFIATVAALTAERLRPGASEWFLFSHRSAEAGHSRVLEALQAEPLLDLGMRLGEGSGAAVAVPLLRSACALHNDMATFEEAGI